MRRVGVGLWAIVESVTMPTHWCEVLSMGNLPPVHFSTNKRGLILTLPTQVSAACASNTIGLPLNSVMVIVSPTSYFLLCKLRTRAYWWSNSWAWSIIKVTGVNGVVRLIDSEDGSCMLNEGLPVYLSDPVWSISPLSKTRFPWFSTTTSQRSCSSRIFFPFPFTFTSIRWLPLFPVSTFFITSFTTSTGM